MTCRFIDGHRDRFGVQPICTALTEHGIKIAPRTYYAWRKRAPSKRALSDLVLTGVLSDYYQPDAHGKRRPQSLYGATKMWAHLNREGVTVARCTVERLMRANDWKGVVRTRRVRTTAADPSAQRAPDLVDRDFGANAPDQPVVADFTYVPMTGSWFGYTAFVIDAFAGLITGWECSAGKHTEFVEKAIRQAADHRSRQGRPLTGNTIHHSDAGSRPVHSRAFRRNTVPGGHDPFDRQRRRRLRQRPGRDDDRALQDRVRACRLALPHRAADHYRRS